MTAGRTVVTAVALVLAATLGGCGWLPAPGLDGRTVPAEHLLLMPPLITKAQVVARLGPWPESEPMSTAELERLRSEDLEVAWLRLQSEFPLVLRPDVQFERYVHPEDGDMTFIDCLRDLGMPVVATDPSSFSFEIPAGSEEDFALAQYVCWGRYPQLPPAELTTEQVGYLYDYFVEFKVPCLESQNQMQQEPPSREDFIASWPLKIWYPSAPRVSLADPSYLRINLLCPAEPVDLL